VSATLCKIEVLPAFACPTMRIRYLSFRSERWNVAGAVYLYAISSVSRAAWFGKRAILIPRRSSARSSFRTWLRAWLFSTHSPASFGVRTTNATTPYCFQPNYCALSTHYDACRTVPRFVHLRDLPQALRPMPSRQAVPTSEGLRDEPNGNLKTIR
jgi:hypothetical protein